MKGAPQRPPKETVSQSEQYIQESVLGGGAGFWSLEVTSL